jgi:hypothetical protein
MAKGLENQQNSNPFGCQSFQRYGHNVVDDEQGLQVLGT